MEANLLRQSKPFLPDNRAARCQVLPPRESGGKAASSLRGALAPPREHDIGGEKRNLLASKVILSEEGG